MDDLLGLSWDQKGSPNTDAANGGQSWGSPKARPPPPPPTSKPVHLQMGLSKTGVASTPMSGSSYSATKGTGMSASLSASFTASAGAPTAPKKNADDVFGSLMPSFGQNGASDVAKGLNAMTLEERRQYDQQQRQQQQGSFGSLSSSPGLASPSPVRPAPSPASTRGYDPGNLTGLSKPSTASSPQPPTFVSPIPKLQQPQPFVAQLQQQQSPLSRHQSPAGASAAWMASPNGLGRSLSPAMTPLQPSRSNNSSPSTMTSTPTTSKDPFGTLLGDQISRSSSANKNQSLNAIRNNTPPLGQSTSAPKAMDPWDLDFLTNAASLKNTQQPTPAASNDVFDLGAFEKAPPEKPSRSNRDSVDALNSFIGKQPAPLTISPPQTSPPVSRREPATKPSRSPPTTQSREDGDIAQIVSMGFSAERAKLALATTENGHDIEAAIEYLVQNDEAEDHLPSSRRRSPPIDERRRPYRDDSDPPLEDRRRRNDGQGRKAAYPQPAQELSRAQQLQQQKDKIVGSASVFGMSVLSKANEIYKQGREKAQALMEDMTVEEPRSTANRRFEWVEDERRPPSGGQYKDSDSEEDEVYSGRRQQQQWEQENRRRQQQQQQSSSRSRQEKETFEDTYVSSSRRGGSASAAARNQKSLFSVDNAPSSSSSNNNSNNNNNNNSSNGLGTPARSGTPNKSLPNRTTSNAPTRTPSPLPPKPNRPPRVLVQASSQQLTESNQYKEKGNDVFKLGQFGQAAELYARASQALPSGHIMLIITQNNRAAALLKIGEYRETIAETDRTVLMVHGADGQGHLDVLPSSIGINLKDQLGKALMRRATAYENLEKYKEAKDDWARLRELDPGHRNAAEGHRRCEKALTVMNGGGEMSTPKSTRKPLASNGFVSSSSLPMQDIFASHQHPNQQAQLKADLNKSEGVSKLRQSAAQQEQDEDERLRLTDQVEKKMTLWKSGKEDNIRALLASLGSVLWEGAAWKPVGMHELVTPAQVKVKYMRAIAKMHPDKLSTSTTIEQRMMANTIFSTLNSAWDAFKTQNNM
ncbi:hypothetical protein EDD11_008548 [Mortierella claussenii]|nr:hypothetical protein EDD11_008548 [Mortierella claussenii]